MPCSLCGQQYCNGYCAPLQQIWVGAGGGGGGGAGGYAVQNPSGSLTLTSGVSQFPPSNQPELINFLDLIADRDDTNACVAFLEKSKSLQILKLQEIEKLKERLQRDLDKLEEDFLTNCKKYRPSIDNKLLARVKGLKAFF